MFRLDGLPLAIELAVARTHIIAQHALLERLNNRLTALTGGARDLPVRQQALRATIDWSYSLLSSGEKALIARRGAFASGWTLQAAEAVCSGDSEVDVLTRLESLLDKSLVRQVETADGEYRFMMLETIREYAVEKLDQPVDSQSHL